MFFIYWWALKEEMVKIHTDIPLSLQSKGAMLMRSCNWHFSFNGFWKLRLQNHIVGLEFWHWLASDCCYRLLYVRFSGIDYAVKIALFGENCLFWTQFWNSDLLGLFMVSAGSQKGPKPSEVKFSYSFLRRLL